MVYDCLFTLTSIQSFCLLVPWELWKGSWAASWLLSLRSSRGQGRHWSRQHKVIHRNPRTHRKVGNLEIWGNDYHLPHPGNTFPSFLGITIWCIGAKVWPIKHLTGPTMLDFWVSTNLCTGAIPRNLPALPRLGVFRRWGNYGRICIPGPMPEPMVASKGTRWGPASRKLLLSHSNYGYSFQNY